MIAWLTWTVEHIAEVCGITLVVLDVLCMIMLWYAASKGYVPMP